MSKRIKIAFNAVTLSGKRTACAAKNICAPGG